MIVRMSAVEGFLRGLKPACYEHRPYLSFEQKQLLQSYPCYKIEKNIIYFQTQEQKAFFVKAAGNLDRKSFAFERILGETLGFPPKAVDYWMEYLKQGCDETQHFINSVGLHYAGVHCKGHRDDLEKNIQWLWDQYQFPMILRVTVEYMPVSESLDFYIPYRDEDHLQLVKKQVDYFLHLNERVPETS